MVARTKAIQAPFADLQKAYLQLAGKLGLLREDKL